MSLTRLALKFAVPAVKLEAYRRYLFIGPHPDGSADAKAIALYLKIRAADFGLRSLKGKAEGFRAMSSLQMHCMPEAGL